MKNIKSNEYYVNLYNEMDWSDELCQACDNTEISLKFFYDSYNFDSKIGARNLVFGNTMATIPDWLKVEIIKYVKKYDYVSYRDNVNYYEEEYLK